MWRPPSSSNICKEDTVPTVPEHVYPLLQVEMPFQLAVPDGRWMVRAERSTEVQRVIVLATLQARRIDARRPAGRPHPPNPAEEPPAVPVSRVTIVDPQPLSDEAAGHGWLAGIDAEQEIAAGFVALNRLLAAQRIAAADPYTHEVAPSQALSLRAGFGSGEQVAQGRWLQARELHLPRQSRWRRGRRATVLRSQERLAKLLSSRRGPLLCEELALRARLDLDIGRLLLAAGELDRAISIALIELDGEPGVNLPSRLAELRELQPEVHRTAELLQPPPQAGSPEPTPEAADSIAHALDRLEAALRARATALAWR